MTQLFLLLLFTYGLAFVIVVWPMHWLWHTITQQGEYDKRFYRQATYWKMYFWVFGTALLITLLVNMWQRG
ncbi:MAG: hypothetical protein WAR83_11560 [Flavobacteriales bacterium]|nr:hypothetical protein [Flavobacteriales bacterium]